MVDLEVLFTAGEFVTSRFGNGLIVGEVIDYRNVKNRIQYKVRMRDGIQLYWQAELREVEEPLCKSCHAEIMWKRTERGKAIPLDRAPVYDGNIYLDNQDTAIYATSDVERNGNLYVAHFTTCPDSATFKSKPIKSPMQKVVRRDLPQQGSLF